VYKCIFLCVVLSLEFDHTQWSVTDEDLIYIYEHKSFEHIVVNLYIRIMNALADKSFQELVYFRRPSSSVEELVAANEVRLQLLADANETRAAIHAICKKRFYLKMTLLSL